MATVVKVPRTTAAGMAPTRQKVDMGDLYKKEDDRGALYVTASKLGKSKLADVKAKWHVRDGVRPKFSAVNNGGGYNDAAVSIVVDHGSYFGINDVIKCTRTGEVMLVTNVVTNTLTVQRSIGATAAAALVDNDEILIIGPAYGENTTLQAAKSMTAQQFTNNIQTFRHNLEVSARHNAIGRNGGHFYGNDVDIVRDEMLTTHKRDLNIACLFGESGVSATDATQYTMGGVIEFVTANGTSRTNSTSAMTESVFRSIISDATRYNSGVMIGICSRQFADLVNDWGIDNQRVKPGDSLYGLRVMDYVTPQGKVRLLVDDALEGDEYSQYCVMVDIKKKPTIKWRMIRDTVVMRDRQGTDQDGYEEEVLTEGTVEWGHPDYHFIINNANTSS
jgi:hypothetical protein